MKVTEVVVSRSVTRQVRPYESTTAFASLKLQLECPDIEEFTAEDYREIQAHVRDLVLDEIEHVVHSDKKYKDVSRRSIAKRYGL